MYTLEEELELGRRAQEGELEARNLLIESNMKLVESLWKPYERPGRKEDDIKQDGFLGMLKAVDTYDPRLGLRFSTYATYAIRDAMKNGMLNQSHTVRLTQGMIKKYTKLTKFKRRFFDANGLEPTYEEIEAETGFDTKTQKRIMHACRAVLGTSHLEGELELIDELDDELEIDLSEIYKIKKAVDRLPHNQHQMIVRYFGLHQGQSETLEDISVSLKCTREAARRLKTTALDHVQALLAIL